MLSLLYSVITFVLFTAVAAQRWGPGMFLTAKSEIKYFSGTLVPGLPPAKEEAFVAIWPGLWNGKMSKYDLVQAVTSSHGRSYMQSFCGARPGQWCTQVYVLRTGRPVTPAKGIAVNPTDQIYLEYDRSSGKWAQLLKINGKVMAKQTAGDIPATKLDIQTEMQKSAKGTASDHYYTNITVKLAQAEPNFGKTLRKAGKVTMDNPRTSDGGKTWTINKITLGAMYPGTAFRGGKGGGVGSAVEEMI